MRTIDEPLAARIRAEMPPAGVTEVAMFGGLCFMLNGNMAVGTHRGGLMVRVGKGNHELALRRGSASTMMQGAKPMIGYVIVDPEGIATRDQLRAWLDIGLAEARALPPKVKKAKG